MPQRMYEVETTIFDSHAESEEHRKMIAFWNFPSHAQLAQAVRVWAENHLKPGEEFSVKIKRVA